MSDATGKEVVKVADDNSIWNRDPALVRGAVISVVGAVAAILVTSGVLTMEQKEQLEENAGTIAVAVMVIIPILQAVWTRFAVWSPRSAAHSAVLSAKTNVPTLSPPP